MGNTNTLLTVKQAAIQMDCKPITIRRWIKSGKIPAYQLGGPKGHLHIPVEALPQFRKDSKMIDRYYHPDDDVAMRHMNSIKFVADDDVTM